MASPAAVCIPPTPGYVVSHGHYSIYLLALPYPALGCALVRVHRPAPALAPSKAGRSEKHLRQAAAQHAQGVYCAPRAGPPTPVIARTQGALCPPRLTILPPCARHQTASALPCGGRAAGALINRHARTRSAAGASLHLLAKLLPDSHPAHAPSRRVPCGFSAQRRPQPPLRAERGAQPRCARRRAGGAPADGAGGDHIPSVRPTAHGRDRLLRRLSLGAGTHTQRPPHAARCPAPPCASRMAGGTRASPPPADTWARTPSAHALELQRQRKASALSGKRPVECSGLG